MKQIIVLISLTLVHMVGAQSVSSDQANLIERKVKEAYFLLEKDNGNLWGTGIWNDSILIIDSKTNSVLTYLDLEGSEAVTDTLNRVTLKENELSYVNTVQQFRGRQYVTVMDRYMKDDKTLIHELFHKMHFQFVSDLFSGPVEYLDEYDARLNMRLEFTALRHALEAMNENAKEDTIRRYIADAFIFRKLRQQQYPDFRSKETELESVEGLAVYTEVKLSKISNKCLLALKEIDQRTSPSSFTRSFAYAMGPAYGLLLDYLCIDWRLGIQSRGTFNFLALYEEVVGPVSLSKAEIEAAKTRNQYTLIEREEIAKKEETEKTTRFYTKMFFEEKTVKVKLDKPAYGYSMTYDMNGTFALPNQGIVYSTISGLDPDDLHFGDFDVTSTIGAGGVLQITADDHYLLIFPAPTEISDTSITGEHYNITLNPGWKMVKSKSNGYEIRKK